ncbi:hypothetical protein ID866_1390 [Astraeus odoratus]|nr:hypothetical protein ID866_1390 [Astraeus odoratus]
MYPHGQDSYHTYPSHSSHHPRTPTSHPPPGYTNQSHSQSDHHYAPPTANSMAQGEFIGGNMSSISQPVQYSSYPPPGTSPPKEDHRSYFSSPHGGHLEHYTSHSSTHVYGPSGHIDPHSSRNSSRVTPQFIPTPSQVYQGYPHSHSPPSVPPGSAQRRSSTEPYYHMSPNPQHHSHAGPVPSSHVGRGSSGSIHPGAPHPVSSPTASGERYPCELCERTFTRSHDRRRHYETVHAATPAVHRCRYCQKDFSRADSLKRHIDNGCDEMPSHR